MLSCLGGKGLSKHSPEATNIARSEFHIDGHKTGFPDVPSNSMITSRGHTNHRKAIQIWLDQSKFNQWVAIRRPDKTASVKRGAGTGGNELTNPSEPDSQEDMEVYPPDDGSDERWPNCSSMFSR